MTSSPTIDAFFLILTVSPDNTLCVVLIKQLADHSFQPLPSEMVGHGKLHTTPSSDEEAAEQVLPVPIEAVHGLFPEEQATILEVVDLSIMSIVDSELIMVAEVALETM